MDRTVEIFNDGAKGDHYPAALDDWGVSAVHLDAVDLYVYIVVRNRRARYGSGSKQKQENTNGPEGRYT